MLAGIERVDRKRRYQGLLGWPGTSVFKSYVNNKILINCNINLYDMNVDENIYREETPIFQGEVMRKKQTVHVKIEKYLYLFQY